MLSILIPTYNYTCYKLVADLHQQAEILDVPYEIIVCEDGSRDRVSIIANHKIGELSHCRHVVNNQNQGQATTRNQLALMAVYDWILFIDSDAQVINPNFLSAYIDSIGKADVVIGGLIHPATTVEPHCSLRLKYERQADKTRGAVFRQQNPYGKFTAFNCLMRRSVFLCMKFDETCRQYGHEDTLFGLELKRRGICILHIDNPLLHTGIDTNEVFLHKTEVALNSLSMLGDKMRGGSRLLDIYTRFSRRHLAWVLRICYSLFGGIMRRSLLSARPSLTVFNLYKLCYFAKIVK